MMYILEEARKETKLAALMDSRKGTNTGCSHGNRISKQLCRQ
jgi:hypothetical protein